MTDLERSFCNGSGNRRVAQEVRQILSRSFLVDPAQGQSLRPYHAFRRFRFAVIRKAGVPDDLIKLWLGHSQNLIDLYAAQLRYDETYRKGWCERGGLGFGLGELGYKLEVPIRPALVA